MPLPRSRTDFGHILLSSRCKRHFSLPHHAPMFSSIYPPVGQGRHVWQIVRPRFQSLKPSVQSPVFSVQRSESSVQSPASRVQRPESCVQRPASRVQRPESSVQSPESSVQSPASSSCVQSPGIPVCLISCDISQFWRAGKHWWFEHSINSFKQKVHINICIFFYISPF